MYPFANSSPLTCILGPSSNFCLNENHSTSRVLPSQGFSASQLSRGSLPIRHLYTFRVARTDSSIYKSKGDKGTPPQLLPGHCILTAGFSASRKHWPVLKLLINNRFPTFPFGRSWYNDRLLSNRDGYTWIKMCPVPAKPAEFWYIYG